MPTKQSAENQMTIQMRDSVQYAALRRHIKKSDIITVILLVVYDNVSVYH